MCRHPSQQALDTAATEATEPAPRPTVIPQRSRQLARLRRVRDRIDRDYAQPLDVEALARGEHMAGGASVGGSGARSASRRTATR